MVVSGVVSIPFEVLLFFYEDVGCCGCHWVVVGEQGRERRMRWTAFVVRDMGGHWGRACGFGWEVLTGPV